VWTYVCVFVCDVYCCCVLLYVVCVCMFVVALAVPLRLCGSVVEHLSCKQKVPGSIPGGGMPFRTPSDNRPTVDMPDDRIYRHCSPGGAVTSLVAARCIHILFLFFSHVLLHVFICARIVVAAREERDHCRARTATLFEFQWNSMHRCFTSLTCVTAVLVLFAMKHVGDSKQRVLFSSFFHFLYYWRGEGE